MFRKLKAVMVELSTPRGSIFFGSAAGVEFRITDGAIAINPRDESYLCLIHPTVLTLRFGTEFVHYVLKNAVASLRKGRLTVLAEEIQEAKTATSAPAGTIGFDAMTAKATTVSDPANNVIRSDRDYPR